MIIYRQCEHGVIKLIDKEFKIKYGPEAGTKIGPGRPEIFFCCSGNCALSLANFVLRELCEP